MRTPPAYAFHEITGPWPFRRCGDVPIDDVQGTSKSVVAIDVCPALFGGSGRGIQWLGVRSLPIHPVGMVSSRQYEMRTVPETRTVPGGPSFGSKTRMRVPSFGAVLIGCHFGNISQTPALKRRTVYLVPSHRKL
jgi:hypothetical protein